MVQVGFIKRSHGLTGELKVHIEPNYLEDALKANAIFVDMRGQKVPLFIEKIREGTDILIKFEDIDSRTEADAFQSKSIFLKKTDILADEEREIEVERLPFEHLEGWKLIDETLGEIGEILRVEEYPSGEMAFVLWENEERLVPLVPVFVKKMDAKKREILMDLPEGLFD